MLKCQLNAQVESREESPALLEGAALDEADPVRQLAQKLDACALDDRMDAVVKTEDTSPPGETPPGARTLAGDLPAAPCGLVSNRPEAGSLPADQAKAAPSPQVRQCAAGLLALQSNLHR